MFVEQEGECIRNALETMKLHEKVVALLWLFLPYKENIPGSYGFPDQEGLCSDGEG